MWLPMAKFAHLDASPLECQSLQQKEKKRGKRKSEKKIKKYKSLTWKDVGHFLVSEYFDFYACLSQNVVKRDARGRKASCHVADAFLTRLKLIWPISSQKISKMPKNAFGAKSSRTFKS